MTGDQRDVGPQDEQLKAFGYAPGGYTTMCLTCEGFQDFVDKRATSCRNCAVKAFSQATGGTMTEQVPATDAPPS